MYVENGGKFIKGLGQMQGRQTRGVGEGRIECLSTPPPDFERIFFKLLTYVIMYRLFLYGGGGGLLPLNWSN